MIQHVVGHENPLLDLLAAELILPAQLPEARAEHAQAERRLMLAVLAEAVTEFFKTLPGLTRRQRRLLGEVEAWFAARDPRWPFSFENICGALSLDPDYLRAGLSRWKARVRAGDGTARAGRHALRRTAVQHVAPTPGRIRRARRNAA